MSFKRENKVYLRIWVLCVLLAIGLWFTSWTVSLTIIVLSTFLVFFLKSHASNTQKQVLESIQLTSFKQRQQFKLIQEQMDILMTYYPHPMVLFNQRGQAILSNTSFNQLIKSDSSTLVYDDKRLPRPFYKLFKQAYYQEMPMIQDVAYEQQFYSAHCLPIYVEQRYQGFLCVLQDVTRLIAQDKLQKRFVADASHELKTPITAIKGISELLCRASSMNEEDRMDFTKQLYDQSLRLEQIVKDLLTLSKLSEDKLMIVKQPMNAKALLDDILVTFAIPFSQHGLRVKTNINDKTVLFVDKKAFESIMGNLLTNVMIHANATELTLSVEENFEYVILHVEDNGKGIEAEHLPHVFERFYRASSSRQRVSGGSGLGLNIVRSYVQAHQGFIEVESVFNQGCKFTLYFPKLTLS